MKIKPEFSLEYELDNIYIVKTEPDGTKRDICPITETAAMAWEGIERGIERQALITAIAEEFDGTDEPSVARDLEALEQQLLALGYAEE